jgi:cell division septation protein DedD
MERPQVKAITGLLTKAAGLVFFAFLAISLGVIFGYLFEDWVKEQPGTAVQGPATTGTEDYPATIDDNATTHQQKPTSVKPTTPKSTPGAVSTTVRYKVRVGPFASRDVAQKTATKLETSGYPVYLSTTAPFTVQVGAFGNQANADHLKSELAGKGFTAFVKQE